MKAFDFDLKNNKNILNEIEHSKNNKYSKQKTKQQFLSKIVRIFIFFKINSRINLSASSNFHMARDSFFSSFSNYLLTKEQHISFDYFTD